MRIISPFKDYYDGVQNQGYDPSISYIRKTLEIDVKDAPLSDYLNHSQQYCGNSSAWGIERCAVVIVAGKPHLGVTINYYNEEPRHSDDTYYTYSAYTLETFYSFSKLEARTQALGLNFKPRVLPKGRYHPVDTRLRDLERSFNRIASGDSVNQAAGLCGKYKSPIIALTKSPDYRMTRVTLSPSLRDFDFEHAMNAYTVYQEIAMYVAGVIGSPANPTIEVGDKVKVAKHGFDSKYGFRTRPKDKVNV